MDFHEWEAQVPACIKNDPVWRVKAYRLSLYAADLGWEDVSILAGDRRTVSLSDQLYRSLGSMGANICEGYSRGTGKDRARFYEYALGSAREARDWYYKGRFVLGEDVALARMELLTEIVRLLLVMVPDQRHGCVREEPAMYITDAD